MNRRRFLAQTAALAASPLGFPAVVKCASPNSLLQVGCIGVARMGGNTMRSVASHHKVKIVALCDVDAKHLKLAQKDFPQASQHTDWRQMLGNHSEQFDAVTIGTPDHMHAPVAVTALRAKKHVYLQKPMAPTVHECRVIAEEAAKAGVVTQMGNQGRSSIESRMMVDLLRSGAIGAIKDIIFWENKPLNWWPQNTTLNPHGQPVPAELDWDAWVGVRPLRPYLEKAYHPQSWRAWEDFGVGELGDMGCHHFDSTFDGLHLPMPARVRQSQSGRIEQGLWANERVVEFEFSGQDDNPLVEGGTLKLSWHDGTIQPDRTRITLPKGYTKFPPSGGYWIGTEGSIFKEYSVRPFVLPEANFPAEKYPRDFPKQDHYHDWVNAIHEGRKACADFDHAARLTEAVLVGTLAERSPGRWLEWDKRAMRVTGMPETDAWVKRAYRPGWEVPGLG